MPLQSFLAGGPRRAGRCAARLPIPLPARAPRCLVLAPSPCAPPPPVGRGGPRALASHRLAATTRESEFFRTHISTPESAQLWGPPHPWYAPRSRRPTSGRAFLRRSASPGRLSPERSGRTALGGESGDLTDRWCCGRAMCKSLKVAPVCSYAQDFCTCTQPCYPAHQRSAVPMIMEVLDARALHCVGSADCRCSRARRCGDDRPYRDRCQPRRASCLSSAIWMDSRDRGWYGGFACALLEPG